AALGLDAADRQQRLAADINHVAAKREREQRSLRESQLPGSHEDHPLVNSRFDEDLVHAAEGHLEWQGDVVREDQRACARTALAAVDRDEIDAARARYHQAGEVAPEIRVADRRLDADRQPGLGRSGFREIEQAVYVTK